MKLYNTLTRSIEEFTPLKDNTVRFYSCGPTVYDHAHIGNLRAYVFADTLHRTLEESGFTVQRVMNYTDIDDKTVRRSQETYPHDEPMTALKKLTAEYIRIFLDDTRQLGNNVDSVRYMPATDETNIQAMRALISELHAGGFAYVADDGVYFSIEAYQKSGKTYGQLLEITAASTGAARIQNDEYDKESAHDFALWKKQKAGEPAWPFTLGGHDLTGRPGWHIECSAMSRAGLGQPFDLHTGGVDNIFPHHENEIAQSTAGQQNPTMAHFFTHNEHLLVDGKKMAKSANNFYTLADVTQKGYDPLAFRLLLLQAHYRSQVNFSWDNLEATQNRLHALRNMASLRWQVREEVEQETHYDDYSISLLHHMQNDLNTPMTLATLGAIADDTAEAVSIAGQPEFTELLRRTDALLGLHLLDTTPDISNDQKALIAEREKAREAKDWPASDKLRDQLASQGIGLRDSSFGPIWYRM